MPDKNSILRDIEGFQAQLDKVFHRTNEDPIYRDIPHLSDAISDNPRFFQDDRRADLAEILFALLDIIYEQIDEGEDAPRELNPMAKNPCTDDVPECDMLLRIIMPLSWGISKAWPWPELASATDFYTASFSREEVKLVSSIIEFVFDLFPPSPVLSSAVAEVRAYWKGLANDPESFHPESEEDKSALLPILLSAAKKHNIF